MRTRHQPADLPAVVVFDLDDTLAPSKSQIPPPMVRLLAALLHDVDVCIISGGGFEQFERQVLEPMRRTACLERLHLMPTCGTQYYRRQDDRWQCMFREDLPDSLRATIIRTVRQGAESLGLWSSKTWGPAIEDRGSQITYSALGQAAPLEAKREWDPDGQKRERLRALIAPLLPGLEVRSGGSTSLDVTRSGIDKGSGIRELSSVLKVSFTNMLFFGDRLDEGGNDYPVKQLGVRCVAVSSWQDTAKHVTSLVHQFCSESGG